MDKYQNKYRISSARAEWLNYGWAGVYFITICTKTREHFFGEIINNKMYLSNLGILADVFWYEIPNHTNHIELGAFIVMPNHIHGILILKNDAVGSLHVETLHATSLQIETQSQSQKMATISPMANTVSTIIRSYKSAVTKHANRLGLNSGWQSRFHDHIIRNDNEYQRISEYIKNNSLKWNEDRFFEQ